jgi:molybdopterin converting factor small subunit
VNLSQIMSQKDDLIANLQSQNSLLTTQLTANNDTLEELMKRYAKLSKKYGEANWDKNDKVINVSKYHGTSDSHLSSLLEFRPIYSENDEVIIETESPKLNVDSVATETFGEICTGTDLLKKHEAELERLKTENRYFRSEMESLQNIIGQLVNRVIWGVKEARQAIGVILDFFNTLDNVMINEAKTFLKFLKTSAKQQKQVFLDKIDELKYKIGNMRNLWSSQSENSQEDLTNGV